MFENVQMKDQKTFLDSHVVHLAIGTPQRVCDLIKDGGLKTENLHFIIIDWSFTDVKKRRMIDYPYIRDQLFDLFLNHFSKLISSGKLRGVLL